MATAAKKGAARKGPTTIARAYFEALNARDLEAAGELWEPGGIDRFVGMVELEAPAEVKSYFRDLYAAFPDFEMEVISITAQKEQAAVRWRLTGTFDGTGRFEGMEPNGARVETEGCDVLTIRDGRIVENHAYLNAADVARQLGALPPRGSVAERGMLGALNAKTATARAIERLRERRS